MIVDRADGRWDLGRSVYSREGGERPFTPAETEWATRLLRAKAREEATAVLRRQLITHLQDPALPEPVRALIRLVLGGAALDEESRQAP